MKRTEVKNQWQITPNPRYPNYEMCDVYDLYKMNISDVAKLMGENYKGTYGTSKDGSKVYEDEIIRVVLCDEESTSLLYHRPINPLSVRILCPTGAKFEQDEKGRDLYNMKAQIHSVDDSQYGIWFKQLPYSKLEYIRKTFLINLLTIVYVFSSLMILCLAIASPFTFGVKDAPPWWAYLILYFLTLIVMASQTQCFRYLDKLQNENDTL